jgi:hypothetical protein
MTISSLSGDLRATIDQQGGCVFVPAAAAEPLAPVAVHFTTSKRRNSHEQHRVVGWRRGYRNRRSQSRWICLIHLQLPRPRPRLIMR